MNRWLRDDDLIIRRYERWGLDVPVLNEPAFMTEGEAKRQLGLRTQSGVRLLVARRILGPAVSPSGQAGVTRDSVQADLERMSTASTWRRLARRLGGLGHWV